MIIRRFFYVLLSVCFLFTATSQAENANTKISLTVMDDGDEIVLSTSLLPDNSITIIHPEGSDSKSVFSLFRPETLPEMLSCFKDVILDWNREKSIILNGFYVGDLFDHASVKEYLEIGPEEMDRLCSDLAGYFQISGKSAAETDSKTNAISGIGYILRSLIAQLFDQDTTACISTFDNQYITIDINRLQETFITISADFSEKNTFSLLMGRRTGDAVYYEELICNRDDDKVDYVISLYRTEIPSFRIIVEQDCIQFAEIHCKNAGSDSFSFEGEIQSILLPSRVSINGKRMTGEENRGIICAEMEVQGQAQEINDTLLPILYSILLP